MEGVVVTFLTFVGPFASFHLRASSHQPRHSLRCSFLDSYGFLEPQQPMKGFLNSQIHVVCFYFSCEAIFSSSLLSHTNFPNKLFCLKLCKQAETVFSINYYFFISIVMYCYYFLLFYHSAGLCLLMHFKILEFFFHL